MPYAVILPVFAALLAAGSLVLFLCACVPPLRIVVPYAWRMLVGSSVGFCVANVFSLLFGVVPVLIAAALGVDRDSPSAQLVAGCALLGLFVGPLVASPIGFLGGAWVGLRRAWEAAHRHAPARAELVSTSQAA
jgi:hypothetical protein